MFEDYIMAQVQTEGSDEVMLDLSGNCIEEAAENKRRQIEDELESGDNEKRKKQLEILDGFLESANFKELRRLGFNGEKNMKVRVWKEDDEFTVVRAFSF